MKNMNGFGLIEILLSVLILSGGLLAFFRLQTLALRHNYSAYVLAMANLQLSKMAECLQSKACPREIENWKQETAKLIPGGQIQITQHQVSVIWDKNRLTMDLYV